MLIRNRYKIFFLVILFGLLNIPLAFAQSSTFTFQSEEGIKKLKGEWEFYWEEFLVSEDFQKEERNFNNPTLLTIPGELTKYKNETGFYPGDTYGTFRTKVFVDDPNNMYGLKVPYFSSANKIWVNGELLFSSGQVSSAKETFVPKYKPGDVYFTPGGEEVEIIIQIANFHHRRVKFKDVFFGEDQEIKALTQKNIIKESALVGGLLLIAIYYAVLSWIQQRDKSALYLSFLSLAVATRGIILSEKIVLHIFPNISGELLMKLGFLPSFLFLPLIALYVREVFKIREIKKMTDFLEKLGVAFIIIVAVTPGKFYDLLFTICNFFFVPMALYIIYIMLFKKEYRSMRGYHLMILGSFLLFLTAVNDVLSEFDVIKSPEMFSLGMFVFIAIQAIFLAWDYNDSFVKAKNLAYENERMVVEIQELNFGLEGKIQRRTRELEALNQKLEVFSRIDPLTGLHNRRAFEERLDREWEIVVKDNKPLSALMLDIDYFKNYNDNYGHISGDECLIKVAEAIKQSVNSPNDFVARYGGEEFIILLPRRDLSESKEIAEQIRINIENLKISHEFSEICNQITVSAGVSTVDSASAVKDKKDFIKQTDMYLYLAKKLGRNRVEGNIGGVNSCEKQLHMNFFG